MKRIQIMSAVEIHAYEWALSRPPSRITPQASEPRVCPLLEASEQQAFFVSETGALSGA